MSQWTVAGARVLVPVSETPVGNSAWLLFIIFPTVVIQLAVPLIERKIIISRDHAGLCGHAMIEQMRRVRKNIRSLSDT